MLVPAAGSAGAGVVAVPIETRYATANHPAQFRKSHFRLVRDLWQITSHVVRQVFGHGDVIAEYRRCRARPPVIDDPDGEFAALQAKPGVERTGCARKPKHAPIRSEERTSELQSLMRLSYAVLGLKKNKHLVTVTRYLANTNVSTTYH